MRTLVIFADEGAPIRALLTQLSAAQHGQSRAALPIDTGYLAELLRACFG